MPEDPEVSSGTAQEENADQCLTISGLYSVTAIIRRNYEKIPLLTTSGFYAWKILLSFFVFTEK